MPASSAQQSGACSRINSASRSRMQTRQDEGRIALLLWMVPKYTDCGLPLFASTIATPVLRREASIASTRIDASLKSTGMGSTWNRQIRKQRFYSRGYGKGEVLGSAGC